MKQDKLVSASYDLVQAKSRAFWVDGKIADYTEMYPFLMKKAAKWALKNRVLILGLIFQSSNPDFKETTERYYLHLTYETIMT